MFAYMIKFCMNETEKSFITENEPHPILSQTQPEQVPYIKDTSIIEKEHLPEVFELSEKAKEKKYSLGLALGGELPSGKQKFTVNLMPPINYPGKTHLLRGASTPWNTGVDINYLITNYPNDRWKFYLSMENKTPEQTKKIKLFFLELTQKCTEKKVALLTKVEDHDYDNPDVYTWQPITMAGILKDLYQDPKFSGIWSSVDHPFQKPISGISKKHIGLVQEPILGLNGNSHSTRMVLLGETIKKLLPQYKNKFGSHVFRQACHLVGVMPTEPWRILKYILSTNNEKVYKLYGVKTETS